MLDASEFAGRKILEGLVQHLHVAVDGPGARRLAGMLTMSELDDPEEQVVDVVALFGALAERGFFTADCLREPTVVLREEQGTPSRKRWQLKTANVDSDAFRVLSNLLVSVYETEGVFAPSVTRDRSIDVDKLEYPRYPIDLPFTFSYEAPVKSGDERFVRIEFRDPLRDSVIDEILRNLDLWASLLVYGGYRDDRDQQMSGAAAEQPILEGKDVIGISILIVRDCSEGMYCSLLNYLARLHAQGSAIEAVSIE